VELLKAEGIDLSIPPHKKDLAPLMPLENFDVFFLF
jgi:hypothetical protein